MNNNRVNTYILYHQTSKANSKLKKNPLLSSHFTNYIHVMYNILLWFDVRVILKILIVIYNTQKPYDILPISKCARKIYGRLIDFRRSKNLPASKTNNENKWCMINWLLVIIIWLTNCRYIQFVQLRII